MRTLYESEDGLLFDSMEECIEYETAARNRWKGFGEFRYYDDESAEMQFDREDEDEMATALGKAFYVFLNRNLTKEEEEYVHEDLGYQFPTHNGLHRYDTDLDKWVSYDEEFLAFKKHWPINALFH